MTGRVDYDEFGLFHENAAQYGLPFDRPPTVRRGLRRRARRGQGSDQPPGGYPVDRKYSRACATAASMSPRLRPTM